MFQVLAIALNRKMILNLNEYVFCDIYKEIWTFFHLQTKCIKIVQ